MIGGFLLSIISGVGSYFKALGDIRQEIQTAMYKQADRQREEYTQAFASKEEARFIKEILIEVKSDLKEIKGKMDSKGRQ